jgi:hypothetical protein
MSNNSKTYTLIYPDGSKQEIEGEELIPMNGKTVISGKAEDLFNEVIATIPDTVTMIYKRKED